MSEHIDRTSWAIQLGDFVSTMAVAPDGTSLVAGSLAGDVRLIGSTDDEVVTKLHEHVMGALSVAWSRDGERFAVGGQDAVTRVYDREGNQLAQIEADGWADCLAWSPTDDLLAIGGGRRLVLTDQDGTVIRRHDAVTSTITGVAWATNGRRIGVAAYGGISWFDPDDPGTAPRRVHHWKGSILALALSPDGKWSCAGAQDASIHIWKLWSGDELMMSGYPAKIERMAFDADSRWLACACIGGLTLWDFAGKGPQRRAPAAGEAHTKHIESLAWRPNSDVLATGGADGRLALWRAPRRVRDVIRPIATADADVGVSRVAWHPDGSALFLGREDGTVERRSIEVSTTQTR